MTLALIFGFVFSAEARNLDALYQKATLQLGGKKFVAYVADSGEGRADGLMHIKSLPKDTGMIFVFDEEQPLGFWMKNTVMPLSIGFVDAKGKLIDIQEMEVAPAMSMQIPTYRSRGPALFAIEMSKGWFAKNKIKTGDRLSLVSKSPSRLLTEKLNSKSAGQ
ncbi:MAG: DUF192 domain-containing protein [Bdellovibrionales bacterium]